MFDIGWSELLLIGIVALIAIGPKELPGALRALGQWMGKIRRMASEFQNQFHEAMREAELADLKKEVDEMTAKAEGYAAQFDPVADIRRDLETAAGPPPELQTPPTDTTPVPSASSAPTTPVDTTALPPPQTQTAGASEPVVTPPATETLPATATDQAASPPAPDPPKTDTGRAA